VATSRAINRAKAANPATGWPLLSGDAIEISGMEAGALYKLIQGDFLPWAGPVSSRGWARLWTQLDVAMLRWLHVMSIAATSPERTHRIHTGYTKKAALAHEFLSSHAESDWSDTVDLIVDQSGAMRAQWPTSGRSVAIVSVESISIGNLYRYVEERRQALQR
jgi:hypothetical protein